MTEQELREACEAARLNADYVLSLTCEEGFSLVAMRLLSKSRHPVLLSNLGGEWECELLREQGSITATGPNHAAAAIRACMAARREGG